jgi:hypothetical protein
LSVIGGADVDLIVLGVCKAVVVSMGWYPMDGLTVTVGAVEVILVKALAVEPLEIKLTTANKRIKLNAILPNITTPLPILLDHMQSTTRVRALYGK